SWPAKDVWGSWRSVTTVPSPRTIAIRLGVNSVCQSGSPNGANEEPSSWSETVIRRGSWSCARFFMPQKAPPVTIVASTRLRLRQRSSPPWASTILPSSLFMVRLLFGRKVDESHATARLARSGQSPPLVSHSYWAYQVDNKRKLPGYWDLFSVNGRAVAIAPITLSSRSLTTEKARLTYSLCPSL